MSRFTFNRNSMYSAALLSGVLVFASACASSTTVSRIAPAADGSLNLIIITEYGCESGQMRANFSGPGISLNGNDVRLIGACNDQRCQRGHGAVIFRSIRAGSLTIRAAGGRTLPQNTDLTLQITESGGPHYIWVGDFGRVVRQVTREEACSGVSSDFTRGFPIPNGCS